MEARTIEEYILSVRDVSKIYGVVTALNHVSMDVRPGEVHALIGENGAGKSTLIKCITGAEVPSAGSFILDGNTYQRFTPHMSKQLGISCIYQEFMLAETLTVAENVFLGNPINKGMVVDYDKLYSKTAKVFERLNFRIDPKAIVRTLSTAYHQIVEIGKALAINARILIMDEPTAPLTDEEVKILFSIIHDLKAQGTTIIYISHRLDELFRVADRVTVLRDGNFIATKDISEVTKNDLIKLMVGRELKETFVPRRISYGKTAIEVKNLRGDWVGPISFSIKEGEIAGLGGLVGAGRTEIARLIFGADPLRGGSVIKDGVVLGRMHPRKAVSSGIGFVTEDRKTQGVILSMTIRHNITLPILRQISRFLVVDKKKDYAYSQKYGNAMRIRTPNYDLPASSLSGGNQQKVVLSKWMASESRVLILDEPTRGIDVGAKQEIYQLINELAEQGIAILLISSEMEEILGLTDRVYIMFEGKYMGMLEKEDYSQERILAIASGERIDTGESLQYEQS
jgi:ribose transport system ATP-binding protein